MTKKRYDKHSTEFGLWLREQPEIDSKLGFLATNVDYMWSNYKTGDWMLIEEKRYNATLKDWQRKMFIVIDSICRLDKKYRGFHLITFEKTNPNDGKIFLGRNKKEISKDKLIKFLKFDG